MGKMPWSKLKFLLANHGRDGKEEETDSLMSKPNVNEEYKEAFRTKSYIEICNKVQNHLGRTTCLDGERESATSSSSPPPLPPSSSLSSPPSPPPIQHSHLSEYILEPHQEPLITSDDSSNIFHQFLVNYSEISLEACRVCESLLANIHQVRNNHRRLKKAMKLIRRLPDDPNSANDELNRALYKNLASFASRRNPFSTMNPEKFQDLRETHVLLLQELTSKCREIKRRKKIIKLIKRAIAISLVMGLGALAVVLLVLVLHSTLGLVAAPGLVMWPLMVRKMRRVEGKCSEERLEGVVVKLDIAARGVYIMINDFATMSRIVKRLRDELERRKCLADVCVRKGRSEMLKGVVRDFEMHECCFVEQLEELERQICLCFLDINRSRRLLVRGMVK